ncbi:MAG: hypothetical protein AXA67_08915 [Methylothermaceae bacteria B42]|nr:MAG: hypothetical protein AXA67_08915 [Methylothermaceae bacteria B42]HHJ39424.1 hypothetical protein [Methylothermaceae bacterium]
MKIKSKLHIMQLLDPYGWSVSEDTVDTFLLLNPALQESPAQTSLFGRLPGCESPPDFRSGSPL